MWGWLEPALGRGCVPSPDAYNRPGASTVAFDSRTFVDLKPRHRVVNRIARASPAVLPCSRCPKWGRAVTLRADVRVRTGDPDALAYRRARGI